MARDSQYLAALPVSVFCREAKATAQKRGWLVSKDSGRARGRTGVRDNGEFVSQFFCRSAPLAEWRSSRTNCGNRRGIND